MKIKMRNRQQLLLVLVALGIVLINGRAVTLLAQVIFSDNVAPIYRAASAVFACLVAIFILTTVKLGLELCKTFCAIPQETVSTVSDQDIDRAARAFMCIAYPVNPIPFARAIEAAVRKHGTPWIQSDEAKAILLVLTSMSYGQLYTVDSVEEYRRLKKVFDDMGK
jgi:hypothetical protein